MTTRATQILRIVATTLLTTMSACSAHSPFIMWKTVDVEPVVGAPVPPAHSNPVLVSGQPVDDVNFQRIATIDVGYAFYGSVEWARTALADAAREVGAEAVFAAKTWHQPAGFGWASPQAYGEAVIRRPDSAVDVSAIPGDRR